MDQGSAVKSQVVEKIRSSNNILITVSNNPSVDSLAAAISLSILLNKLEKHPTAIFSGNIPPAIEFLDPEKTFENNVDGLRDFIISLDKEKADRLRYKVEENLVRIFITPYRTTINQDDFKFSQGDFNVDLVLALGVDKREDLDKAISAHGRILHDAAVVTIGNIHKSSLGSIDWLDTNASSLCEIVLSMVDDLGQGLLDTQVSNALLTGIVASTERFSNKLTTPRVMTAAAKLMAAGANQQLIADNLQKAKAVSVEEGKSETKADTSDELSIRHSKPDENGQTPDVSMDIDRVVEEKLAEEDTKPEEESEPESEAEPATAAEESKPAKEEAEEKQPEAKSAPEEVATSNPVVEELKQVVEQAEKAMPSDLPEPELGKPKKEKIKLHESGWRDRDLEPPSMGGTLNATSEAALKSDEMLEEEKRNSTILSHDKSSKTAKEEKADKKSEESKNKPEVVEPPLSTHGPKSKIMPPSESAKEVPVPPPVEPKVESTPVLPAPEPPKTELPKPPVVTSELHFEEQDDHPPLPPAPVHLDEPEPEKSTPAVASATPQPQAETKSDAGASHEATLGELDVESARQAVQDALAGQPFDAKRHPVESVGAQTLDDHLNDQPVAQSASPEQLPPAPVPENQAGDLPPPPPLPPMPANLTDLPPTLEPMAPPPLATLDESGPGTNPVVQPPVATTPPSEQKPADESPAPGTDPTQFKIPGQ